MKKLAAGISFLTLVTPAQAHCCPGKNEEKLLEILVGKSFKEKNSTQDLVVERITYPQTCHPRAGGGPGDQTRSCHREKPRSGYISCVALGPRLRGGDKFGGCNITSQALARVHFRIFPGQQCAQAGAQSYMRNVAAARLCLGGKILFGPLGPRLRGGDKKGCGGDKEEQ